MKYTITQFKKDFPDDDACLGYMFKIKYPTTEGYYRIKDRKCYSHKTTKHQIHPTAGTIFHKSSTPLWNWFFAIYLMSASKNGVSAKELERHLGVTYKTAWRMAHQIRFLMKQDGNPLEGIVEADETYVGGRKKGDRGGHQKAPVIGLVQRKGRVQAKHVDMVHTSSLLENIGKNVRFGSRLITDGELIYKKSVRLGMLHDSVKHSDGEYVRGDVHTNTIEGFWSQMKRSINGTYHAVSVQHLQSYVDEFAWKYNERLSFVPPFVKLMSLACGTHGRGGQKMFSSRVPVA